MIKNKFFTAEELRPGIWQITNYFDVHRMWTYSYLIEGSERALVIDTMFGYGNLKNFCRELTDRPLTLVNTHYHGDHTGGNFDFDECYIHALDIPNMRATVTAALADPAAFVKKGFERMKNAALDEYRDRVQPGDTSAPHHMGIWPVWDGDIFDLGGRHIQVIHVGGHTAGEIVLLSLEDRYLFSGDACNSNTLCGLPGSLSVEEYLESLYHFKQFQPLFDEGFGGHEPFFGSNIDEGIELCKRVLDGTDDREESTSFGGRVCYYGALRKPGTFIRVDGKRFNICYVPENIRRQEKKPQVIK